MPINKSLTLAEYFAHPAINNTRLKKILKTPLDFLANQDTVSSIARLQGNVIHCVLLEPSEFDNRYFFEPVFKGKGMKAAKAEFLASQGGKIPIPAKIANWTKKFLDKVKTDFNLRCLIASGDTEVSAFKMLGEGIEGKARADLDTEDILWDVKSTSEGISDLEIYRTIKKHLYHFQAAHYCKIFGKEKFGWIFIDTKDTLHLSRRVLCPPELLSSGFSLHDHAINILSECLKTQSWPGYPETVEELKLPTWAKEIYE